MSSIRPSLGFLHRWVGLVIAGFLFISGLTGAIISWDHALDDVLNPHLMNASSGRPIPPLELVAKLEASDPRARVTGVPLAVEPGKSLALGVDSRVDPKTGKLFELGYNQVFFDPVTGVELGRRDWGALWPITRETFVSFLYVLHYSLHIPEMWGIDHWGVWLLGGIAMLWTVDCFVGFYLTLPARRAQNGPKDEPAKRSSWARWKPAWLIKISGSAYRINFDIHRAFGLWVWGLLFTLAFTAFSLNLYREVFYPIMSAVSEVTPSPFDQREERDKHQPIEPRLGFAEIIERARSEAIRRGWEAPAGGVFYGQGHGIYGVSFHQVGDDHGSTGVGPPALFLDSTDGRVLGDSQPWKGTAADIFVQAQFPLHSGRILGLPGRILISLMGLVVAALSVTGVVIWWKKRGARAASEARLAARRRGASSEPPSPTEADFNPG